MKCPKCGNEQSGTEVCAACGLIFEKYHRHQQLREQQVPVPARPEPQRRGGVTLWTMVGGCAVLIVAAASFFFFRGGSPATAKMPEAVVKVEPAASAATPAIAFAGRDFVAQLQENAPPGNEIEAARNATVFLETPWGRGAGFFVDEKCTIVTNRHVVNLSDEAVAAAERDLAQADREVERLKSKIKHNERVFEQVVSGQARITDSRVTVEDLRHDLDNDRERLDKLVQEIVERRDVLENSRWSPELAIVLADGSKVDGMIDYVSSEQDLALVKPLPDSRCPRLVFGSSEALKQGDTLYTIGSPMGIRHAVTSGIYSGSLEIDGRQMLQTDAPINPGNSGGPLIDKAGRVVGINTLVMNNAQGIGFAIPIETALTQFPELGGD